MSILSLFPGRAGTEWMDRAACRPHQWSLFFPEPGSRRGGWASKRTNHKAKRICARCPVRQECLRYALSFVDSQGIWLEQVNTGRCSTCRMRRDTHDDADHAFDELVVQHQRYSKPNPVGIYGGMTAAERSSRALRGKTMDEQVAILDEMFKAQAEGFLVEGEEEVA